MRTTKTIALVLAAIMLAVALSACSVNNPNYTVLKVGDMNIGVNAYYNNYNYLAQVYSMYGLYNVSTPEAFKRMQDQVFDNLINNALPLMKGIGECTYEDFSRALAVGVTAPFYLTKLMIYHREHGWEYRI